MEIKCKEKSDNKGLSFQNCLLSAEKNTFWLLNTLANVQQVLNKQYFVSVLYFLLCFCHIRAQLTISDHLILISGAKLSQPNNNHNPNNKTTITVVGLRLSNRWEPPPTTTTQTQNYMIEQKWRKTEKTKAISLYEETVF